MTFYSRVNCNLAVTKDQWVISLTRKGGHAIVLVESFGYDKDEEGLCMRWFDFLQKQSINEHISCLKFFSAILKNKIVEGVVRYCPKRGKPGDMSILANIQNLTKKDIFSHFNWNYDTDSWACDPEKVKLMLNDIRADMQHDPSFQYKGRPTGVNCTTWAWQKLKIAGINAENDNCCNKIAVSASHNIGNKRGGCVLA